MLTFKLKGLAQAKIIKKSVILFRVLNMTIWCKHVHRLELQIFIIFVLHIHQLGRDVCVSTVHLLSRWKFSAFVVCALSERWWFCAQCLGWIVSLVFSVWQHHFFQMVTEPCKGFSDVVSCHSDIFVVQRSIDKFYLMNTAIGSTSWWWLLIRFVWRYWFYCIVHASCTWFLTFINEFESVQKHRNLSDVHHKGSL